MRRLAGVLLAALAPFAAARGVAGQNLPPTAAASYVGRPISAVTLEIEGVPSHDRVLFDLVETRAREPLSMERVRETLTHLFALGRFQGIEVRATDGPAGSVAIAYELMPLHGVSDLVFTGELGLSDDDLERVVVERFGKAPPAGRADAAARLLEQHFARHGFLSAQVEPTLDVRHNPDRTILVFKIRSGPRARIGRVAITGVRDVAGVAQRLGIRTGEPYDQARLEERLTDYLGSLHRAGRYEATADHRTSPRETSAVVDVEVDVRPGPVVRLAFEGDPLPRNRIAELVPVEREASVDEDLLEDSDRRIRDYLLEQGHWKARVGHRRERLNDTETITFTVNRGPRYEVGSIELSGNASVSLARLRPLIAMKTGEPFVEGRLTAAIAAIRALYLREGFAAATVDVATDETPPAATSTGRVDVRLTVREGVLTRIGSIAVTGNAALGDAQVRQVLRVGPGDPFYEAAVAADREAVLLEYLNQGYAAATVAVDTTFSTDRTRVDLTYRVVENARVIVDHVIIVGNTKTKESLIRRELLLEPGKPLALSDVLESQRRLSALGLFRRVRITEVAHGAAPRRDIIVSVEEANRTTLAYGAGIELIPEVGLDADARALERYDIAPRGSFEIGRRNLWGRNRSVNLFTRVSFRPRGESIESPESAGYGFNEYRVVGTYRESGVFGWNAEAAVNGYVEQAIRSSFNFRRRGVNAELLRRVSPHVRLTGRYTLGRTQLLAARIPPEEQLDIDRLFPQVRLSSVSLSTYRDTRDDALDPSRGTLLGNDTELAMRLLGSQVGFVKTFVQGFVFHTLSRPRRIVLASGARLGVARGFAQIVEGAEVVTDLPASERFFAGGSTTVRGFALDRLGAPDTISESGFAQGGNALLVLNLELRAPVWRDLSAVGFVDAGNVFARIAAFDVSEVRVSPGFGLRYRSPIGPIRLDVGFKLPRRELSPGRFEGARAFHISVGHAF